MVVVAAINYRGIGESVRSKIGLTFIEVGGLLLIIVIALGAVRRRGRGVARGGVHERRVGAVRDPHRGAHPAA
jgi:hypothetical protein